MNTVPQNPIGVIGAMQKEVDELREQMTDVTVDVIAGREYVRGLWEGRPIVAAVSGVGKVFSAICAQSMILRYAPRLIINVGVSGGLSPTLSIGDIVVADEVVQHDMDTTGLGDEPGLLSGINRVYLPCSPQYTSEKKVWLREQFRAISCEMEGASIGTVCYVNGVDCCVLRAISDGGNENAQRDFTESVRQASLAAQSVLYA